MLYDSACPSGEITPELFQMRNEKARGEGDPIDIDPKYRMLSRVELSDFLETKLSEECLSQLDKNNDLRGLRVLDNNILVIEAGQLEYVTEKTLFSNYRTIEFHRIIIGDKVVDMNAFQFPHEKVIWKHDLSSGWIYVISQLERV